MENARPAEIDELAERSRSARELLTALLTRMGYAELMVRVAEEAERIVLLIEGDEAGALIGKKGQTLDALQYLVNKMLGPRATEEQNRPIVVDCNGYRERRIEALVQLARRVEEQAARNGKTIAVNPMSAHDRRIVHMALRDSELVSTRSEGEGLDRRLLVEPKRL